jgi:hypothetical protein
MKMHDINDKLLPALLVFSLSIKYLKTHLLRTLKDRILTITTSDVKFVLTVPAIWTDAAKQFMREAAIEVKKKCAVYLFLHLVKIFTI